MFAATHRFNARRELTRLLAVGVVALGGVLIAEPAHADTFTVTNTSEEEAGSLHAAILAANANPGRDTIEFDIPAGDGGPVKLISPTDSLPTITGPVTIDGYTQPGAEENTRAVGSNAKILIEINGFNADPVPGLSVRASNVVVRGLAINRFKGRGVAIFNDATGVRLEGNFIGTDTTGTLDRGNNFGGVSIESGDQHTIGGTSPAARNVISGNNDRGITIIGDGENRVMGNVIGPQADGTSFMTNTGEGIAIFSSNNTIGGREAGAGNTVAFNSEEGVMVRNLSSSANQTGNRILGNSISRNSATEIDLGDNGRTENDPLDRDTGANTLQNFPVLDAAADIGSTTRVSGILESTPSTREKKRSFTIQFFTNGSGEDGGARFLGQQKVTTSRKGMASFSITLPDTASSAREITATATGPGGNTSEFSAPVGIGRL